MITIPLTHGKVALIDDEDLALVAPYSWNASKGYRTFYAHTKEGERTIWMHRLILGLTGNQEVDHWDGNGLNNTRKNLRPCTGTQNQGNARRRSDNTSGAKGVSFHKPSRRWRAQIGVHGKRVYLGVFDTVAEAAEAYDDAARKVFGQFAILNSKVD